MKQITKTSEVMTKLRAAFGVDANVDNLAVYEAIALNTRPLRKTSGLFVGARASLSLLTEMAAWINRESIPLRSEHLSDDTPYGRIFYGEVFEDELRALFAVDKLTHPEIVTKLDNGVIDQVSVGMKNKHLNCSKCGFDYMAANAEMNRWTGECPDGHKIGEEGTFLWIDGLDIFLETSLVGIGAGQGAKIVGPTDSRIQASNQYERLAASAKETGIAVLCLSPTQKEASTVDLTQLNARIETLAGEKAVALTAKEAAEAQVTTLTARVTELEAAAASNPDATAVAEANTAKDAAVAEVAAAVTALTAEAKAILTACGEDADKASIPGDVAGLVELIADRRTKLSALIPPGGLTTSADQPEALTQVRSSAAFSTRR